MTEQGAVWHLSVWAELPGGKTVGDSAAVAMSEANALRARSDDWGRHPDSMIEALMVDSLLGAMRAIRYLIEKEGRAKHD